jgi:hypothetical protein
MPPSSSPCALSSLSIHFPELTDVWTNDLLPFLVSNIKQVRNQLALITWTFDPRVQAYGKWVHVNTRWVNDHTALMCLSDCRIPTQYLVHVLDGHVHCMITRRPLHHIRRTFDEGKCLCLDASHHHIRYWKRSENDMLEMNSMDPCCPSSACMNRFLTLHSIRRVDDE